MWSKLWRRGLAVLIVGSVAGAAILEVGWDDAPRNLAWAGIAVAAILTAFGPSVVDKLTARSGSGDTDEVKGQLAEILVAIQALQQTPPERRSRAEAQAAQLSGNEALALGLILSQPDPTGTGAFMYPLHDQLTARGLTPPEAGAALALLAQKGLTERQDVIVTNHDRQDEAAPAFKVTEAGLRVSQALGPAVLRKFDFRYTLRFTAKRRSANAFFEAVRGMPHVQRQTRYYAEDDRSGEFRMYVFSYEEITGAAIRELARQHHIRNLTVEPS